MGSALTNATTVQYAVTFNEGVTGVTASDFSLAISGTSGTIASVNGNSSSYTVTVDNVSGNGTLGLNLVDSNTIIDQYGNPLGGPALGDGNFTGQLYTIDTTGPSVATAASHTPSPVTGTTSSLAPFWERTPPRGQQASFTCIWTATTLPSGTAMPTFSANGTNAAKNVTATFSEAGDYAFQVTITDPLDLSTTAVWT